MIELGPFSLLHLVCYSLAQAVRHNNCILSSQDKMDHFQDNERSHVVRTSCSLIEVLENSNINNTELVQQ